MNLLTVVDRGGVKHPEILTVDEAQNLLDKYGVGGQAIKIPNGVNLQKFLGRCTGGWYYDNAALSNTTGGPIKDMVYYTIINGGVPGNRAVLASSHGNNLWIAEVYGDVFRGWVTFTRPDDVHNWIDTSMANHELSVNHPYATDVQKGFVELATTAEAASRVNTTRVLTVSRGQDLLNTYGIGSRSISVPAGSNLASYFNDKSCGFYHLDTLNTYVTFPTDAGSDWGEIIVTAHEPTNYRGLTLTTSSGKLYTAAVTASSFSGWKKRIELADLPASSTTVPGIVQLNNTVTSTSTTQAGTANAVKIANDNANTRVPSTRTVNSKALSANITLSAADVGAYTTAQVDTAINGRVPNGRTVNGLALSANISITAALVGAYTTAQVDSLINGRVPNGRTVNGKALSANITLSSGDVGAYTKAEVNALLAAQTVSLRLGPEVSVDREGLGHESFVYRAPGVNVVTGMSIWSQGGKQDEFRYFYSRPIQIYQGGTWTNIAKG